MGEGEGGKEGGGTIYVGAKLGALGFSMIFAQSEGASGGSGPFDVLKDFRWL